MPAGTRFGDQDVFEGEEICGFGAVTLTWERMREAGKIHEINRIRDERIASTKRWAIQEIEKIMDARAPLLIIICVHDEKLCDICREKCGETGYGWTDFRERMGGPPFHYGCRCYLMETGGYGTYLFEGKTVNEGDLSKLNWIREEEAYRIPHWVAMAKMQADDVRKETQDFIDNYFANCRAYVDWYEVICTWGTHSCDGEKGTKTDLEAAGCGWPYTNPTCWPEYVGYEVIEICTGE